MFNIGDYIIYGSKGVCQVADISNNPIQGVSANRKYYTLKPINLPKSQIITPVDNDKIMMRPVMTQEEIQELIHKIPDVEEIHEMDEKARERVYKEALSNCDSKELVRIIKTSYLNKVKRHRDGKKSLMADEKYFKLAESRLYEEIGFVMSMSVKEVADYLFASQCNEKPSE